jgi:PAS domain S-box-containing protein
MNDSYKILALNDDSDQLELLEAVLSKAGYQVFTAADGKKGFEIAQSELPDLIISDVMMPRMDGIELCRLLRADEKLRPTPVLLVSAVRKDTSSMVEGIEAGADDYMQLPYEPMHLVAKAARLIERKHIQDEALQQSETRFRSLIENVSDVISMLAPDGTILYESPSLENVLGYQPDEIIGKNAFEFIHPEDFVKILTYFNQAMQTSEPSLPVEYRFRHKDNSWRILESIGKPFDDTVNGLVAIITSRDITKQEEAQEALRMSEERFRLASLATEDALWDWDLVTDSLWLSDPFYKLLGYQRGDVEPHINLWYESLHPDEKERVVGHIHEVIESGEHFWADEYRMRTAGGDYAHIFDRGYIVHDQDGKPIRMIGAAINFTERKRAEQQIRGQLHFIEAITDNMAEGICAFDRDGRITFINPAAEEMLGWKRREILGRNIHQTIHYQKADGTDFPAEECRLLNVLETGEPLRAYEDLFIRKNKTTFPALCFSAPLLENGEITGAVQTFHDVTERKRAEMELDQFFKVSVNLLCLLGFDGYFKRVNPAFVRVLGYTKEELLSTPFIEFVHPDDRQRTLNAAQKTFTGEETASFENRYVCKNGSVKWLLWNSATLEDEQMVYAVAHDITERKNIEEAIRFQAHLLDTVEQAIIATDLEGVDIYWNRFAEKLYGWTAAEALGRNIIDLTPAEISQRQAAHIMGRLKKGESWAGEFKVRNRGNQTFPAYVCSSPVTGKNGELIGIVGVSTDISERKKAEKDLAEANQRALREYDKLLKKLTKLAQTAGTARDLITIFRAILEFTRTAVPCTGFFISLYNEKTRLRTPAYAWDNAGGEFEISNLPPMEMSDSPHSRAVATGEVIIENDFQKAMVGQPVININLDKDPNLPQSCLVTPMAFMGRVVGAVEVQSTVPGTYRQEHATGMQMAANLAANAIENVRLLEKEREREEQLRQSQKLESVGRLAGGIAHDFNNMLTAINGYSDLTLRRLKADDPLRYNIEEIKKAGERSAALTHQLLAFSRKQILKPKVLDINEVIADISKLLQRLIGEDVQLSIVTNPKVGCMEVDPGQLTQVIMNLSVNARDAMPRGGNLIIETSNVYLSEEYATLHYPTKPGAYVMLAVSDNGVGIEEEALQHIFEPFYTTKEVGKGTGLGLATVYGIVKQSNGFIWVYSEVGKGTTFKIYFPRVDEICRLEETSAEAEDVPGGSETILLVEDEEAVRNLARQILESCGYKIIEARNGIEALSLCQNSDSQIDLLITDVVMPKMGGRELAEKISQLNPQIRQLFMSGYTDDAIIRQGMITEDMNFIQKPFTFETLAQKVREALDAKK